MVKERCTKAKQLPKRLFWGRRLSRGGAPRAACLILARGLGLMGRGVAGQIGLGGGFGHAGERDCSWRELRLMLTWASGTSLFGGARMGRTWRKGPCLSCRFSRSIRGGFWFGSVRGRVYLLLTLGAWRGHVHPQGSLHLTVQTKPLLDLGRHSTTVTTATCSVYQQTAGVSVFPLGSQSVGCKDHRPQTHDNHLKSEVTIKRTFPQNSQNTFY